MIITMMIPLKGWRGPRQFMKCKSYFHVAAIAYTLAHTIFYFAGQGSVAFVAGEISKLYVWTG
jgi:sulfoxide reductase heme-binding subunit YedZ